MTFFFNNLASPDLRLAPEAQGDVYSLCVSAPLRLNCCLLFILPYPAAEGDPAYPVIIAANPVIIVAHLVSGRVGSCGSRWLRGGDQDVSLRSRPGLQWCERRAVAYRRRVLRGSFSLYYYPGYFDTQDLIGNEL